MEPAQRLRPFVAGFVIDWLIEAPHERHRTATGTLAFVDISGFTKLTERLASKGKIGAEEMSDTLDVTFAALLAVAYDYGAWLVKWGGDAVLLLFEGEDDAARACTAAHQMRRTLRQVGHLQTSVGKIDLRMSIGLHTGVFDFFLVGSVHRELVICGQAATEAVSMETVAEAGEIVMSSKTARAIRPRFVGEPKSGGFLLARSPAAKPHLELRTRDLSGADLGGCVPEITRDHLLSGGSDGEHRMIGVAFVEFSGIATLLHRGIDTASREIDAFIRACQESAQRHQVTFWETDVGTDGGKVMLVSGAPRSAGNDEDRILAAVREIVDSATHLSVRAGVNYGRVYSGEFGPPFRRTYSVKGDAVNLAARLMAKAAPGEVYASETVVARARTAYATERLAPFTVKGKARPVHAHRLGKALGAGVGAGRTELAFGGRDEELGQLLAALDVARAGTGQVWEIAGAPGIGKSRLVAELLARAGAVTVCAAGCDQYHSTTPYAPFRRLLRQLAGIAEEADRETAGEALRAVVKNAAPSLERWLPLLAAVVGAQMASTPEVDALEATFRKTQQELQAIRFLSLLVPGPLLLVVEDAHLLDDASRDLLRRIAAQADERPWLVLATSHPRPPEIAAFDPGTAHRMELSGLPPAAVDAMVKSATEDRPLPPHELAMLSRRAGGNPLFVEELLGATRNGATMSALPDSVEGVIAVQIDRLPPLARRVLRIASVLGASADMDVLDEMLTAEGVDVGSAATLLGDFVDSDGRVLRFRHALARDTAYEGLPFQRRQALHGLAGEVIERRAEGRPDDVADLLSLHYWHARDFQVAWRYASVAGDRARDIHAQAEAAELYERAIDAARRVQDRDGTRLAEVAEALADARYKLGDFSRAALSYRFARTLVLADVDHARLCYKCSLVADRAGRFASALRWLTKARNCLESATGADAARLRAQCAAQYGLIRHWQGRDDEAVDSLAQAVGVAEEAGAQDALATALVWLDNCEMTLGRPGNGEHAQRALEIWRKLGSRPWEEARVLNQLGIRAYFRGEWDVAVDYYRESKVACERAGDQFTAAVESGNMAEVLSDQGRLADAEPLLRDAQRVWRAAAAPSFVAFGKSQLGRLAARAGRFDEALQALRSAREDYVRDGEHGEVLETDARLAECLLLSGAFEAALSAADDALTRAAPSAAILPQVPVLQRVRGLALACLGNHPAALGSLESSLAGARERQARHEVAWGLHALLAVREAAGISGDPAIATECAALLDQLGIVRVAEPVLVSRT